MESSRNDDPLAEASQLKFQDSLVQTSFPLDEFILSISISISFFPLTVIRRFNESAPESIVILHTNARRNLIRAMG